MLHLILQEFYARFVANSVLASWYFWRTIQFAVDILVAIMEELSQVFEGFTTLSSYKAFDHQVFIHLLQFGWNCTFEWPDLVLCLSGGLVHFHVHIVHVFHELLNLLTKRGYILLWLLNLDFHTIEDSILLSVSFMFVFTPLGKFLVHVFRDWDSLRLDHFKSPE